MRQPIDPARTVENTGKRVDECITLHFDDHLLGHIELGVQVHHQRHRSYTQTQVLRAYSQLRNHRFVGKPDDITYAITARLGKTRPDQVALARVGRNTPGQKNMLGIGGAAVLEASHLSAFAPFFFQQRIQGLRRKIAEYARSEEHTSELQSLMRISYD